MSKGKNIPAAAIAAIRVSITKRQGDELSIWAERGFMSRDLLVSRIVDAWLKAPARELLNGQLPCDLGELCERHRRIIAERKRIVLDWRKVRLAAKRRKRSVGKATAEFLRALKVKRAIVISRATLFNWHRMMKAEGDRGLADNRMKATLRDAGSKPHQTGIKDQPANPASRKNPPPAA